MLDKEQRTKQTQALANRLRDAIQSHHDELDATGERMLTNDMLSALAHVTGSLLTHVPEAAFERAYQQLGRMVVMSYDLHRLKEEEEAAKQEEAAQ